jgi:hypothetical protein
MPRAVETGYQDAPSVPDYGLGDPGNTQEWIRRTYGAPSQRARRQKAERSRLVDKYGEHAPVEDMLRRDPSLTHHDFDAFIRQQNQPGAMGWEDWLATRKATQANRMMGLRPHGR